MSVRATSTVSIAPVVHHRAQLVDRDHRLPPVVETLGRGEEVLEAVAEAILVVGLRVGQVLQHEPVHEGHERAGVPVRVGHSDGGERRDGRPLERVHDLGGGGPQLGVAGRMEVGLHLSELDGAVGGHQGRGEPGREGGGRGVDELGRQGLVGEGLLRREVAGGLHEQLVDRPEEVRRGGGRQAGPGGHGTVGGGSGAGLGHDLDGGAQQGLAPALGRLAVDALGHQLAAFALALARALLELSRPNMPFCAL